MNNFINSITSISSMATTIAISKELKDKIANLGKTGESYEDVIRRMYEFTSKNLIKTFLYDESDSIDIDKAIKQAKQKWPE